MDKKLQDRFFDKVNKTESCWYWTGAKNGGRQYGVIKKDGMMVYAHRLMWQHDNNREIPEGMCVCHHCDTPKCVNPDHLFLGTHSDNMKDAFEKGRGEIPHHVGEEHHKAKLSKEDVKQIKKILSCTDKTHKEIAKTYPVNKSVIGKINTGDIWSHVEV
jgi:hypothetical protein